MLNTKTVSLILLLSLMGCTSNESNKNIEAVSGESLLDKSLRLLDEEIGPVFENCINFAAYGAQPNHQNFVANGYKAGNILGVPIYKLQDDRVMARINFEGAVFGFAKIGNRCNLRSTGYAGVFVVGGWASRKIESLGWQKVPNGSRKTTLFEKASAKIILKGLQSGSHSFITLTKG